jgi:hypothetical protein
VSRDSLWSYSCGAYGHTVRVYARKGRANLFISYTDRETGKLARPCLGHSDRARAKKEARELADALTAAASPSVAAAGDATRSSDRQDGHTSGEPPSPPEMLSWDKLFDTYTIEESIYKKGSGASEDARRVRLWKHFMKLRECVTPAHLDKTDVNAFVRMRRAGTLVVPDVALKRLAREELNGNAVKDRTVHADLVYLITVLNWATEKKDKGTPWLVAMPIRMPSDLKKKARDQPVAYEEDVRAIRRAGNLVDSQQLYSYFIRLHDNLGWRVTPMCAIKASEVSLERSATWPWGYVIKNQYVDKEGVGQRVPLSKHAYYTLLRIFQRRKIVPGDDAYLFPAKLDVQARWTRWHVRDLQLAAEKLAGISPIGGTHAIRRKWVSERKHHPISDIMAAGGWTDIRSLEAYLKADPGTMYEVVSTKTARLRRTPVRA